MMKFLASTVLAAFIAMFIRTHALTITKHIVMGWVWLYSAIAPKEDRDARRGEVLSHIYELINTYQKAGYAPGETAIRLLEHGIMGMADDMGWSISSIPEGFADKVKGWSDILRHYRIPSALIAGVATLGLMNYSFFSSTNQTFINWLIMNGIVVVITVLLWKIRHPLVRRILYSWMGAAMVAAIAIMVWVSIQYRLYEITTFKIFILAMVPVFPVIIVVDKSGRQRFFRSRWWLIAIFWAPIIAGSFAGSLLITHSIKPLLEMWAVMALLAVGIFILCGATGLVAYGLCWIGVRGSAGGLSLVASTIRRLR